MSPLEATGLTLFLLQQKMLNPDFQVSHKEFFANLHQKQMEKWQELRAQRDGSSRAIAETQAGPSMEVRPNPKSEFSRQAVKMAAERMAPDALLNLADTSLDTLGVKR